LPPAAENLLFATVTEKTRTIATRRGGQNFLEKDGGKNGTRPSYPISIQGGRMGSKKGGQKRPEGIITETYADVDKGGENVDKPQKNGGIGRPGGGKKDEGKGKCNQLP